MPDKFCHQVRIIAGKLRGRNFPVSDKRGLRPTPDRVRETVFAWLGEKCNGAKVLDLFAGSGVLGAEALSRGATKVTTVELNKENSELLKVAMQDLGQITVVNDDAVHFLKNTKETYDLVFLDPPYATSLLEQCLPIILERKLISHSSIVYVEMNAGKALSFPGFEIIKEAVNGQVKFALWKLSELLF